jgi:RNA polymerase sigma-70 factor (ECF subfamily)
MSQNPYLELSDEEVALAARRGDIAPFEVLVERYEQALLRYILRISHFSKEEAEEILQEVFLKTWKNLQAFDTSLKFSSWIYHIAHNQTISEFRKVKSRGLMEQVEFDDELLGALPSKVDLPQELNAKLEAEKVRHIIDELAPKYRDALVLRFLEEKSYEEISDILHVPLGTAATLVSRAKLAFTEKIKNSKLFFQEEQ